MNRLNLVQTEDAKGKQKDLLEGVQKKLGMTPNLIRVFANSPAVLEAYLGIGDALGGGALDAKLREQIALTVAETNECNYCVAAHTAIGKMAGLNRDQIEDARRATSSDGRSSAALNFARAVVETRGKVSDADIESLRAEGFDDGEIAEIVANVVANILTNYFNNVAHTPIDFPKVDALETAVS